MAEMAQKSPTFKDGDTVQLKTGGPNMIIHGRGLKKGFFSCVWFDEKRNYKAKDFLPVALKLVPDELPAHEIVKNIKGEFLEVSTDMATGTLVIRLREVVESPPGTTFYDIVEEVDGKLLMKKQPESPEIRTRISGIDESSCKLIEEAIRNLRMRNEAMGIT